MTRSPHSAVLLLSIVFLFSGSSNTRVPGAPERIYCSKAGALEDIITNDNRTPAGQLIDGVLHLNLEVRMGNWYPESKEGMPIKVYAFAEAGKALQLPGPLIRVKEGTRVSVTVKNLAVDTPFVLYGFHPRPSGSKAGIVVPYGQTYQTTFIAGAKGTYFYRATAGTRSYNNLPYFNDSQLYGAFIIDTRNEKPDPNERIFMVGIWNDTLTDPDKMPNEELAINGLSWPFTERLTYTQHQDVKWRIINASNQAHPMHLHGFYYTVNSKGNADSDNIYQISSRRVAVTELIHPHETRMLTWNPQKAGNWLFHCHTLVHIMPYTFLRTMHEMSEQEKNDVTSHATSGMGGLIMGIHVLPDGSNGNKPENRSERKLTLIARDYPNRFGKLPGKGFELHDENVKAGDRQISVPGPAIILKRDEPVAIKIVNMLHDPTTVHWHGLEIESFFDGAAGWGSMEKKIAPLILPDSSFVAHLIPPRAGTFIYHTHMHDDQLIQGMYGPLIVTAPGEKFNPETDKIFLVSSSPPLEPPVAMLNGSSNPDTMRLKSGTIYRFRLINITALNPGLAIGLLHNGKAVRWRPVAKDGADLPLDQTGPVLADSLAISIGETRDFQFHPTEKGNYSFEVRDLEYGKLYVTMCIRVE